MLQSKYSILFDSISALQLSAVVLFVQLLGGLLRRAVAIAGLMSGHSHSIKTNVYGMDKTDTYIPVDQV